MDVVGVQWSCEAEGWLTGGDGRRTLQRRRRTLEGVYQPVPGLLGSLHTHQASPEKLYGGDLSCTECRRVQAPLLPGDYKIVRCRVEAGVGRCDGTPRRGVN